MLKLMRNDMFFEEYLNDILNSISFTTLKTTLTFITPEHFIALRYSSIAQKLEIFEVEVFQMQSDFVFIF